MRGEHKGRAALLLALVLLPGTVRSFAEVSNEEGDISLDATGSARFTGAYMRYPDLPLLFPNENEGLVSTVQRILLEGDLGEHWGYETNLYVDLYRGPLSLEGGSFTTAGTFDTPYRQGRLTYDYWQNDALNGSLGIDRLNLTLNVDPLSLTVGRVPLNYSVTTIFAPNDFFAPFSTTAINKIYKPGVDAVRLNIATGMLSTIEIAAVLGNNEDDTPTWGRSALIAHLRTVLWEYEWALMGGKLAERWMVGASLQGPAGPFGLRAEGHMGFPDEGGDGTLDDRDGDGRVKDGVHTRLSVGLDIPFEWHNSSIGAAYLYLSDGARDSAAYLRRADRFYPDDLYFMARHYLGLTLGGELIPILRLSGSLIVNADDGSGMGMISLVYSLTDESELLFGLLLPWGERPPKTAIVLTRVPSEFGLAPLTAFLETRFYY